jgi:hypothetical protein
MGIAMLELRRQERTLKHEAATLQEEIAGQQGKLWNQQLQISLYTAPNAIARTVGQHELKLVPEARLPEAAGDWMTARPEAKAK